MADNVFRFRRVKWGDPERKLKVLAEDIDRPRGAVPALAMALALLVAFSVGAFLATFLV